MKSNESREINNWRNEHGEPDFVYLQSLVIAGTIEAMDKLKSIAEDLDINLDPNALPDEIIEKIRMAVKQNQDGNPNKTN